MIQVAFQREPKVQNIFNHWLWKAGTLIYNKRVLTDVDALQTTYPRREQNRQTELQHTNMINNRGIETDQWLMTSFTRVLQPMPLGLNRPIAFNRPDW